MDIYKRSINRNCKAGLNASNLVLKSIITFIFWNYFNI